MFHRLLLFSLSKESSSWLCSAIYASLVFSVRSSLWDLLSSLRSQIIGPWLMIGDFNEIKSSSEVSGGSFSSTRASLFSSMMDNCKVMDLELVGGLFNWRGSTRFRSHIRKKLDRCMA